LYDGVADLGITGQDLLANFDADFETRVKLGIGRCSLVAAVPKSSSIESLEDFDGISVATSHKRATANYFEDRQIKVDLVPLKGSVEVAPKLGIADAIVDLVSSGSTLLVNSLRPVLTILESEAVLASRPSRESFSAQKAETIDQVTTMLQAVVAGRSKRYLLMNAPATDQEQVIALLPSLDSPTVIPLADGEHVAIHTVIDRDAAWSLLPQLKKAGATGLLVVPIGQLIP
jgi:ATP phosphoribosyltransferase